MFGGILIIENNFPVLESVTNSIGKLGHRIYIACNAWSGIALAESSIPSLIICSTELPDFNTADFQSTLSHIIKGVKTPVFFLSPKPPGKLHKNDSNILHKAKVFGYNQLDELKSSIKEYINLVNNTAAGSSEPVSVEDNSHDHINLTETSRITLKVNNSIKIFRLNDIEHIIANRDYTYVYTKSDGVILIKKTLKSWEDVLPKNIFLRINRSAILNMDYVDSITRSKWHSRAYYFMTKVSKKEFLSSQRFSSRIKAFLFN